MIKIEIQLDELETVEGKKAGRISCESFSYDPVGNEEVLLRDLIFRAIKRIGEKIGEREGSAVSISDFPIGMKRRRRG